MLAGIKSFCSTWWAKAMTEPDVNSRLVFLGTFVVTAALMIYHSVVYLHFKTNDPQYPTIIGVLAGGNGVNFRGGLC